MEARETLEKLNNEIFEKTGFKMDIDTSLLNLDIAYACEMQRQDSHMPEIPVISAVEMIDRQVFFSKMDSFHSDYFFFLKPQEKDFDKEPYFSSFYEDEEGALDQMIDAAIMYELQNHNALLTKWLNGAECGDRIRVRKYLNPGVSGRVVTFKNNEPVIIDTDQYIMIFEAIAGEDKPALTIVNAYPV